MIRGSTKKAAYASGLAGEPLIPVQAVTSAVFAVAGVVGLALFLSRHFRLAALIPVVASWDGALARSGCVPIIAVALEFPFNQVMAIVSVLYLSIFLVLLPSSSGITPNLSSALAQLFSAAIILPLLVFWAVLFLYYGRSRITASTLSFHVIAERL